MRKFTMSIAVSLLMVLEPTVTTAQQPKPSYAETVAWILSKIEDLNGTYDGGFFTSSQNIDSVSMPSCRFSLHSTSRNSYKKDNNYYDTEFSVQVDLGKVTKVRSFRASNNGLFTLELVSDTEAFSFYRHAVWNDGGDVASGKNGNFRGSAMTLGFQNQNVDNADLAARLAKAFQNAVDICRAQAPVKNEPF